MVARNFLGTIGQNPRVSESNWLTCLWISGLSSRIRGIFQIFIFKNKNNFPKSRTLFDWRLFSFFLRSKLIIMLCKARLSFQVCVSKGSHLPAHNLVSVLQKSVGEPAVVVVVVVVVVTEGGQVHILSAPLPAVCRLSKTLFSPCQLLNVNMAVPYKLKFSHNLHEWWAVTLL
jgi:hypothetical protein